MFPKVHFSVEWSVDDSCIYILAPLPQMGTNTQTGIFGGYVVSPGVLAAVNP